MSRPAPSKKQTLLQFLVRGVTMVHLDARRPGVQVPPQFTGEAHLRLNLSYRYQIPNFEVGDAQVDATLSFGGSPFHCVLPWESIFGITSHAAGDGQVWPEDLPTEVMQTLATRPERDRNDPSGTPPDGTAPRRRPALVKIEGEEQPQSGEDEARDPAREQEAPKRHLRLVR